MIFTDLFRRSAFAVTLRSLLPGLVLGSALAACSSTAIVDNQPLVDNSVASYNAAQIASDERVLTLAGSSNFRDLGGYKTESGKTVRRGLLFRSGAMTSLTEQDMAYLNGLNFSAVVDLRSSDELELYPNRWVQANQRIDYINHPYSMMSMMSKASPEKGKQAAPVDSTAMMAKLYRHLPQQLKPQLRLYFAELLESDGAVVVNCSAGQDRTGFASAMLLTALGVSRDTILEDYLLSTQYRRPANEKGDVDLKEAAKTNAFAAMMLHYSKGQQSDAPNPLYTADGTPFLVFALDEIDTRYGSVSAYLEQEIGVDAAGIAALKKRYLN